MPDGSKRKEDWRKAILEALQKKFTKRMAEPLSDIVLAAQQAEAMRMAVRE